MIKTKHIFVLTFGLMYSVGWK